MDALARALAGRRGRTRSVDRAVIDSKGGRGQGEGRLVRGFPLIGQSGL